MFTGVTRVSPIHAFFVIILLTLNMMYSFKPKLLLNSISISRHNNFAKLSTQRIKSTKHSDVDQNEYLFGVAPTEFSHIPLIHPMIIESLSLMSRVHATSIQNKALPALLENNDVVISSETGSGKTLAYLIPLYQQLFLSMISDVPNLENATESSSSSYPSAIILVPNKDLAAQVVNMSKYFSDALFNVSGVQINVNSLTRNVGNQRWPYKSGSCPNILVCTPVIISNFVRGPIVTDEELFNNIKHMVFDEADMLVEGSYLIETEKILEALKKSRRQKIRNNEIKVRCIQYTTLLRINNCD